MLLPLHVDGLDLRRSDNELWTWRGTLDWPLFGRHLNEGESVTRAILRDRRSVGANIVCCAGMLSWWEGLTPSHPNYWPELRHFADICAEEDMRLCLVVFCDTRSIMPNVSDQVPHWDRIQAHLGDKPNVLLVGVNQPGHPSQSIDPLITHGSSFSGQLCARDNPLESGNPVLPALDFSCYCSSRNPVKGWVEVGSSMWYVVNGWSDGQWTGVHQPSVLFEPLHCRPTDWTGDPGIWRQLARSLSFRGTVGGNFYSNQCSIAELFSGIERDCAVEFLGNIPKP